MRIPGMNDDNTTAPEGAPDHSQAQAPGQGQGQTQAQAPIGVYPGAGETGANLDGLVEEGPGKSGSGTLVLIALVIVSGAVLWGMRHLGTRGSINLVDISIDYPITDTQASSDHTRVIQALQDSTHVPQVDPKMIAVNPFTWRAAPQTAVDRTSDADREEDRLRREHERRMRALDTSARNLVLNSVMRGRVPIANISGEMVVVGGIVGEHFTVTRIEGREVDVQAEGRTWTLTVGGR